MANYNSLISVIQSAIYDNSEQDITGAIMQQTLVQLVNRSVKQGALFKGKATPTTNPNNPDANVFYIASQAGTYVNFGGVVVPDKQLVILTNQSGSWEVVRLISWADSQEPFQLDEELADTTNAVENRAIYTAINSLVSRVTTLESTVGKRLYLHLVKCVVDTRFFGFMIIINNKSTFADTDVKTGKWIPLVSTIFNPRTTSGTTSISYYEYYAIKFGTSANFLSYTYRYSDNGVEQVYPYEDAASSHEFTLLSTTTLL